MRIGIDASRGFVENKGGPEYYTYHLIKNISKIDKKNQYILYLYKNQSKLIDFYLPPNFSVKEINLPYLWTQVGLAQKAICGNLDLLFVPAHTLPVILRLLKPNLPIVVTIHGLEGRFLPHSGKKYAHIYRNWSITWAIKLATHLICVSNYTKTDILKHYKIKEKKLTVIYEGVDRIFFKRQSKSKILQILSKYGIKKPYILFVGTVQPRKNLIRLIKAYAMLTDTKYSNIDLIIAGKLGWLYQNILKAPKRYQVEDRVKFIGRVQDADLPALYTGAELFVLPSITEGFGLPVLEAQASGCPVVTTAVGAPKEIGGEAVVAVNPFSALSIKEGIVKVLQNPRLRQNLIKKGLKNAQKMTWRATAYNTIKLFSKILKNQA